MMRSYHCSGLEKDFIPNSTACSSRAGQVRSADGLGTIAQTRMAGNPPEAVGGFFEVLGLGLGAAAYHGFGRGFRAGTAPESICCTARKNRAPCLSLGAGDFGAAKGLGRCCKIAPACSNRTRTSPPSISPSRGNEMTPKEFQKSNLPAAELADESLGEYGWPNTDCFRSGEGCYE